MRQLYDAVLRRQARRRSRGQRYGYRPALEKLEAKTPLAVDVSLSDMTLTLTYGAVADAAVLAIDDNGDFTVTGLGGTVISGVSSGSYFDDVFTVNVVNASNGGGQFFGFTSAIQLPLLSAAYPGPALAIGSETSPIATVSIAAADYIGVNGPVAIYAGEVSISGTVYGPGESLVIVASGAVAIDDIDEFAGAISIACASFTMSGSLLNDGWNTSGPVPGSGGLDAGNGYAVAIDAIGSISIAGALSANGGNATATASGAGSMTAGRGGAITLTAGGSISVPGGVSAGGGSTASDGSSSAATATAGAGGSITMQAGTTLSLGGLSVAGGSTQAGSGTKAYGGNAGSITLTASDGISVAGSINAAGGTGQTASGTSGSIDFAMEPAASSASLRSFQAASLPSRPRTLDTRDIVAGDIRLQAANGLIGIVGSIKALSGDVVFAGPARLMGPTRVDSAAGGGGITFTHTIDGRQPLAVAAGSGSVAFGGPIGATAALAGIRFESAAAVTAAGRVNVAGGGRDAFRHGIEIRPGVANVSLRHGGTIRDFKSGQAIHIPEGSAGSTIRGFLIVNSGLPYVGWQGAGLRVNLADNVVVAPIVRGRSARITSGIARTNVAAPPIGGVARSGERITLYANGIPVGSTVAVNGRWTIVPTPLGEGVHILTVRGLSADGVAAGFSPAVRLTVRTTRS
jgi:hypothetical protein